MVVALVWIAGWRRSWRCSGARPAGSFGVGTGQQLVQDRIRDPRLFPSGHRGSPSSLLCPALHERMARHVCKCFCEQSDQSTPTYSCVNGPLSCKKNFRDPAAVVACSRVSGLQRGTTAAGPDGCPRAGASSVSRVQRPRIRSRLLPTRRHCRSLHHASSSRKHLFSRRPTSCRGYCCGPIDVALGHQRPGDAGHLVREGNRNLEPGIPAQKPLDPAVGLHLPGALEGGLGSDDQ
jgi:hypothetical protein